MLCFSFSKCWFCRFPLPMKQLFPFLNLYSSYVCIMPTFKWFSRSSLSFVWLCFPVSWVITTFYHVYKSLSYCFFLDSDIHMVITMHCHCYIPLFSCILFISPLLPIMLLLAKTNWVAFIRKRHRGARLVSNFPFLHYFQLNHMVSVWFFYFARDASSHSFFFSCF